MHRKVFILLPNQENAQQKYQETLFSPNRLASIKKRQDVLCRGGSDRQERAYTVGGCAHPLPLRRTSHLSIDVFRDLHVAPATPYLSMHPSEPCEMCETMEARALQRWKPQPKLSA